MIGSINGTIIDRQENTVIIEATSGVGYRIFIGGADFELGQSVRIFTYHHVREDADDLYGFKQSSDLKMFEILLTVSGVGPKMAQNVLNTLGQDAIIDGVVNNQPAIFKSVSGVGQKLAEKIIVELKNKVGGLASTSVSGQANSEIFEALVNFGYHQTEILAVLKQLDAHASMADKLKQALRLLTK